MKKLILILLFAVIAAGMVFAQAPFGPQGQAAPWGQAVTVEGTLILRDGRIALESGDAVYFVPMLSRYTGFIDGLKEGANVSIHGYAGGRGDMLMPTALTLNGKSYDFSVNTNGGYAGGHRGGSWGRGYNNGGYHGGGCRGNGYQSRGGGWCY